MTERAANPDFGFDSRGSRRSAGSGLGEEQVERRGGGSPGTGQSPERGQSGSVGIQRSDLQDVCLLFCLLQAAARRDRPVRPRSVNSCVATKASAASTRLSPPQDHPSPNRPAHLPRPTPTPETMSHVSRRWRCAFNFSVISGAAPGCTRREASSSSTACKQSWAAKRAGPSSLSAPIWPKR